MPLLDGFKDALGLNLNFPEATSLAETELGLALPFDMPRLLEECDNLVWDREIFDSFKDVFSLFNSSIRFCFSSLVKIVVSSAFIFFSNGEEGNSDF